MPTLKTSIFHWSKFKKNNPNLLAQYLGIIGLSDHENIIIKKVEPN